MSDDGKLDPAGLTAARVWFRAHFNGLPDTDALTEGVITAYIAALPPAGAGEVVVPREPTGTMIRAGVDERDRPGSGAAVSAIYRAMIAAAPAIELSGNSGELPVPTNTVGGEVAAEKIKRYAWQRLTGSTTLLPVVREDGDWVKFSDVVDICAANQRLRRSLDTTSRHSVTDLHEQADELWMKLMPAMQTSAWEDGSRDVYADKVAALAMIEAALSTRSAS